jgi:hypothetical protein
MLAKPRSLTTIGIAQLILASSFVVWLLFFPSTAGNFAWPVTPEFTAMFLGACFIVRAFIGFFLWRAKAWPMLRWQVAANYAFLTIIFLATFWHIEAMNWKSDIVVAHIWVIAYIVEPVMLFLIEPRTAEAKAPLPAELQGGPVLIGLKRVTTFGLIVSLTIGGLAFINPLFLDTRWPWPLDPFNARIIAAFLAMTAMWCVTVYFAENWGEVRLAVYALAIFALSQFIVWLIMLPGLDHSRENVYSLGIAFALYSILFIYYIVRQERLARSNALQSSQPH